MVEQNHRIMRQVLEVHGCSAAAAENIRSEIRDVYYRRLLPSIEKVCSELSASDRIDRIDTLEVDLGDVSSTGFGSALADKFEALFRTRLAAAIDAAPRTDSGLELFTYFLHTGLLPWWAGRAAADLLDVNLEGLIRRSPQALRQAIGAEPDQGAMRRRIARAHSDRVLDELAGMLNPSLSKAWPVWGKTWSAMLEAASRRQGYPAGIARLLWWEEVLRASIAGGAALDPRHFLWMTSTRAARGLGADFRSLVADLRHMLHDTASEAPQWARDLFRDLSREPVSGSISLEGAPAASEAAKSRARDDKGWGAEALSAPRSVPGLTAVETPGKAATNLSFNSRFSDGDEIYVDNAGLVVLWPFLERFFGRFGLIVERKFKNEGAAQRAVGLLQFIAGGDVAPPEYLLPLNKLLCGLAPDAVFDFGPGITAEEIDECNGLIAAVIAQAPILNEMSIGGFRASFLLREGQLGARDGHWLLRVERLTHDIVLDRFPWSVHFVKLPWMQALMRVEW